MKVVCDTNIWYRLHANPNIFNKKGDLKLVLTFNTLNEFAQSSNMVNHPIFYKSVAKAIINHHDQTILHNPFHHIKVIDDINWKTTSRLGEKLYEEVKLLAFTPDEDIIEYLNNNGDKLSNEISNSHSDLDIGTEHANNLLQQVKREVKSIPKNRFRGLDLMKDIKNLISKMVEQQIRCSLSDNFDWSKLELFIEVIDYYFKDLALQSKSKIEPNDWIDLFNLVYVNPGIKYWTYEKKWIRIIDDRINQSKYLFKPQLGS